MVRSIRTKTRWLAGVAITTLMIVSAMTSNAETMMGSFMQDIGVPANDVVYFGWNPVGVPTTNGGLMESRWNFGMAMYEYNGGLQFTFVNGETSTPLLQSIFTSFYFDDGSTTGDGQYFFLDSDDGIVVNSSPLSDPQQWTSTTGVNFHVGGGTLPEPNILDSNGAVDPFVTTNSISWQRNSGPGGSSNGVNAIPEFVTFHYSYQGTNDFASVMDAFNGGDLRIGTHVQGFNTGDGMNSETILWIPTSEVVPPPPGPYAPVPVPAAAGLGFLGMALVGVVRRKKS